MARWISCFFTVKENIKFLCQLNLDISTLSEAFYGYTVKKSYSPAKFSTYSFGKADAQKKFTEEGHFRDFFTSFNAIGCV
ncbi:hypothetical protein JHL18_24720 [Clostridium sp. YIM B02505]|uniref:Uncharacterized protein n=1 Tax=Clostridium yunnanense TaxID=2800325 RepID=A0ABS1EWT6_9CLOT|nr:hypothetical protein [Clostridium yunnanense]MBK1813827.1 hypothetical protein [Clostridium yunnanense]